MRKPKLLILGASLAQIPGILVAKAKGCEVVSCDNQPSSPGHTMADAFAIASTFEPQAVLAVAQKHQVDGVMTIGSDQPVLTAALVAHQLGLPAALSVETARAVTDKRVMKQRFQDLGLPTVPFVIFNPAQDVSPDPLELLSYPVVVKPVDSQGQRGIFVLTSAAMVRERAPDVLHYSRTNEILVETYYDSDEVTVSGWVRDGQAHILTLTDRVRFPGTEPLGVCLSHEWPSRYLAVTGDHLSQLSQEIVSGFGILNGPIYFQFLIGADGIRINEVACRIGGAFESQFIPLLTGFDLTAAQIDLALGLKTGEFTSDSLIRHDFRKVSEHLSVQLFFAKPCTIQALTPLADVQRCPGVIDSGYHIKPGHTITTIDNATSRVGYCIVTAPDRATLEQRLVHIYEVLKVIDTHGVNQIIHRQLEVQ